jgi:chromosomal replication initiator protein
MSVRQTFETLTLLPFNAAAQHACRMVAEDAAAAGVVLLHGPTGIGKTHLLRAVADAARRRCACRLVETRAVDLIASIVRELRDRDATRASLRYFGRLDLLIVDDLEWLFGKGGSQIAVGQLFRTLVMSGATVVCASGIPPGPLCEFVSALDSSSYRELPLIRPTPAEMQILIRHLATLQDISLSQETERQIAARSGGDIGRACGLVAQFAAAIKYSSRGAATAALARVQQGDAARNDQSCHDPLL